jgi:hypothetical protein
MAVVIVFAATAPAQAVVVVGTDTRTAPTCLSARALTNTSYALGTIFSRHDEDLQSLVQSDFSADLIHEQLKRSTAEGELVNGAAVIIRSVDISRATITRQSHLAV